MGVPTVSRASHGVGLPPAVHSPSSVPVQSVTRFRQPAVERLSSRSVKHSRQGFVPSKVMPKLPENHGARFA